MTGLQKTRVLFVCLGNICRSPTAEGVFRNTVQERGLAHAFEIDSAGTGDWHIGAPPDRRACAAANRRGINIDDLRARQTNANDMAKFDVIIAMDRANLAELQQLAGDKHRHKVKLFLEFGAGGDDCDIPDPYYGGEHGFDQALDLIEQASTDLLDYLIKHQ